MRQGVSAEFVAECERIALEERADLGLKSYARLEPRALAEAREIEIVSIDEYRDRCPAEVKQLTERDRDAFSAATVFCGTRCVILVNPNATRGSGVDPVAHEVGHLLVEHTPRWPLFDAEGNRNWRENEEDEADYMAEALLVPIEGVTPVLAMSGGKLSAAAAHFGVSEALMQRRVERSLAPLLASVPTAPLAAQLEQEEETLPQLLRRLPPRSDGGNSTPGLVSKLKPHPAPGRGSPSSPACADPGDPQPASCEPE